MPQNDQPSASCPRCPEPPEPGDVFCGACGARLPTSSPAATAPADSGASGGSSDGPATADGAGQAVDHAATTVVRAAPAPPPPTPAPAPAGKTEPGPATPEPSPPADVSAVSDAPAAPKAAGASDGSCVACGTGTVGADGHCTGCGHQQPLARDHWERECPGFAGASDRGLRHRRNEDFFTLATADSPDGGRASIAVVCDGVSSARRSDQASEAAATTAGAAVRDAIPRGVHAQEAMHDALFAAARAVDALATDEEREAQRNAPACTIVGAVVGAEILTVGWIGDSRAYWVPDDREAPPVRLTEDDSWAAQMVAAGLMTQAQAFADARAHAITGWLGADAYEIDPHTASFQPDGPGVVVVCSDGLWNYAETAEEMAAVVPADAAARPLAAVRHLVGFALDGGGHDNVTVAVVPFPAPAGR